jgi:hypothetical protein
MVDLVRDTSFTDHNLPKTRTIVEAPSTTTATHYETISSVLTKVSAPLVDSHDERLPETRLLLTTLFRRLAQLLKHRLRQHQLSTRQSARCTRR